MVEERPWADFQERYPKITECTESRLKLINSVILLSRKKELNDPLDLLITI